MTPFRLDKKTAIVTGAGSGIGESIALLFAQQGADVAVIDLNADDGNRTVDRIQSAGGKASFYECDVAQQAQVAAIVDQVNRKSGGPHILINNAGIAHVGNLLATTEADLDRIYNVNVKGAYNCLHACVEKMLAAGGGAILNLASIAAITGVADRFAYSMSKGAILTMTYSVAIDYVKHNIRCNCICPARIHTPFVDGFLKKNYPGREEEIFGNLAKYQPVGRMGTPNEVAHLALYLCSDEAGFITGSAYPIDGGVINCR